MKNGYRDEEIFYGRRVRAASLRATRKREREIYTEKEEETKGRRARGRVSFRGESIESTARIEWEDGLIDLPRAARGTESGSDERGNRATLCACSSFRGKQGQSPPLLLSPSTPFVALSLAPSVPPPLLLLLVTSAPGIPRLRRRGRQRRKSERASWAAKRRGVVNDSSEPLLRLSSASLRLLYPVA